MILIFDLDDTLYDERQYVLSGFRAVANFGSIAFGIDPKASLESMEGILARQGRGKVFDEWLRGHGLANRKNVERCVQIYRQHEPRVSLPPEHRTLLEDLSKKHSMYVVTDGNKEVQRRKVEALEVASYFRHILISHRFGVRHAKPSLYCFNWIRKAENCEWADLLYVGDNPKKDFVNLNGVGAMTVRVRTGAYADTVAQPGYDARYSMQRLSDLPATLRKISSSAL